MSEKDKPWVLTFGLDSDKREKSLRFRTEDRLIHFLLNAMRPDAPRQGTWMAEHYIMEDGMARDVMNITQEISKRLGFSYVVRESGLPQRKTRELEWLRSAMFKIANELESEQMDVDDAIDELRALAAL